jgi:hypothetical protein
VLQACKISIAGADGFHPINEFCKSTIWGHFPAQRRHDLRHMTSGLPAEESKMDLYVIRRSSAWANLQELEVAGAKSTRIGDEEMSDRVRWIRSYVINEPDGRIGTFCIYQARDGGSIREHARRVGMPGEDFHRVAATVVVRPDPAEAKPA